MSPSFIMKLMEPTLILFVSCNITPPCEKSQYSLTYRQLFVAASSNAVLPFLHSWFPQKCPLRLYLLNDSSHFFLGSSSLFWHRNLIFKAYLTSCLKILLLESTHLSLFLELEQAYEMIDF